MRIPIATLLNEIQSLKDATDKLSENAEVKDLQVFNHPLQIIRVVVVVDGLEVTKDIPYERAS